MRQCLEQPDLWRGYVFAGGLLSLYLAESWAPARVWRTPRSKRLGFHLMMAVINTLILRLIAVGPLLFFTAMARERGWGLAPLLGLSGAPEIIFSLVALDFLDYWWHRLNHSADFFWRFHKVHHVDTHVDVTTSLRFHPGEFLISSAMKVLWVAIVGPSLLAFAFFEAGITLASQFHHTNIDFPFKVERWLRLLFVTPRYHAAHHTVTLRSREANFSTIFIAWDRLFGSYQEPDERELENLGLPRGREGYLSLSETFLGPFSVRY